MPDEVTTDVQETAAPVSASTEVADSSPAVEPSGESQASVTGTDDQNNVDAQVQGEAVDPLTGLPTDEELQAQVAQKVPYAQALAQLRPAYVAAKSALDSYKPLDPWREFATANDLSIVQANHELANSIFTQSEANPSGFTTTPFLQKLEEVAPGAVDQLFVDISTIPITDNEGKESTVVREMIKSWGLDPNRIDDYRNIDSLRVSGVVTADELGKIPEKYHEAFKSLPRDAQEDLLALKESNPTLAEVHLRNADRALASERFETAQREREQRERETQQQQFEQQLTQAVEQDIVTESQALSDSIHQNLASVTLASDPTLNDLEHLKIMGVLGNLQSPFPVYRDMAVKALKAVGVEPNGFADTVQQFIAEREQVVKHKASGQIHLANQAESRANFARQRILLQANDMAMKLAQAGGQRAATAAQQVAAQTAVASGRYVPNTQGANVQGKQDNPYAQNPHPFGSPEYFKYYRDIDKANEVTGASMFGS